MKLSIAFLRLVVFEKMKKHILQLIVDYDVTWDAKKVEFAKSGTGFRLSWKPL